MSTTGKNTSLADKLFFFAAGVDFVTISDCTTYEQNKHKILGSLVYIPVVTSFIAVLLTCSFLKVGFWSSIIIATFWCGLAFFIERGLIGNLRPIETWNGRLIIALGTRFVLALSMSMIISELMIMTIFKDDIMKIQGQLSTNDVRQINERYDQEERRLESVVDAAYNKMLESRRRKEEESDGTGGSMRPNQGKIWKEKEQAYNDDCIRYEEAKTKLQQDKQELAAKRAEELTRAQQVNETNGILTAVTYLHKLTADNTYAWWALLFAHIFFLCVELMPLFTKLIVNDDEYYSIADEKTKFNKETKKLLWGTRQNVAKKTLKYKEIQSNFNLNYNKIVAELDFVKNKNIIIIKKLYELLNELDTAKPEEKDVVEKLIEDYKSRVDDMLNTDYYRDAS